MSGGVRHQGARPGRGRFFFFSQIICFVASPTRSTRLWDAAEVGGLPTHEGSSLAGVLESETLPLFSRWTN